ncbi:MAG: tetratricopeptide repeat protein [Desulfonatronovibrio sp.]
MSDAEKKGFIDRIMSEADDSAHPFLQKIQDNLRIILAVTGIILFVAAAYSLNSFWQERKINQANSQLETILAVEEPESRISQLETFLDQAPERLKGAILLEMARTSMNTGEYSTASDSFEQLGRLDPEMRPVALLGRAKAFELMQDYEQAVSILQNESSDIPDEFRVQYLNLLSFNAENAGDYPTALKAYEDLKEEARDNDLGFLEYKIATIRQKLSN